MLSSLPATPRIDNQIKKSTCQDGNQEGSTIIIALISDLICQLPQKARDQGTERCLSWLESVLLFARVASSQSSALYIPSDYVSKLVVALHSSCLPFLLQLLHSKSQGIVGKASRALKISTNVVQTIALCGPPSTSLISYAEILLSRATTASPVSSAPTLFIEVINLVNMLLIQASTGQLESLICPPIV